MQQIQARHTVKRLDKRLNSNSLLPEGAVVTVSGLRPGQTLSEGPSDVHLTSVRLTVVSSVVAQGRGWVETTNC